MGSMRFFELTMTIRNDPSLSSAPLLTVANSERRHDRYESEPVRDKLTMFSVASIVKKLYFFFCLLKFLAVIFLEVFHQQNNPKSH